MTHTNPGKRLVLCAGMQSSGSTLLSWCFLQRADVDGVLDARFDVLPQLPKGVDGSRALPWVKMTIACFGLADAMAYFRDEGWEVSPVLLLRDVRAVFNSLLVKEYGRNSTTADDPPIRLRLRRFKRDWEQARREGWTMMRYEDLADFPRETLETACRSLGLPWDEGMLTWPKRPDQIADARHGNVTFLSSLEGGGAMKCLKKCRPLKLTHLPAEDLAWLEEEFAEFNKACQYPRQLDGIAELPEGRAVPTYEASRRYWRQHHGFREVIKKLKEAAGFGRA